MEKLSAIYQRTQSESKSQLKDSVNSRTLSCTKPEIITMDNFFQLNPIQVYLGRRF